MTLPAPAFVVVRPCIYDEGHEGPCVGLQGEWWGEIPITPGAAGVFYAHLGWLLRDDDGGVPA